MAKNFPALLKEAATSISEENSSYELLGIDLELSLYDLSDLFYAYHRYHNVDSLFNYEFISEVDSSTNKVRTIPKSLSRFEALRRVEASVLGSRPFFGSQGIAAHIPNISLGYMKLLSTYSELPYKSLFTDTHLLRAFVDKKLIDHERLSTDELETLRMLGANNPNLVSNAEIGDDISDALSRLFRTSKQFNKCIEVTPTRIVQDALIAFLHSDIDWEPRPIFAVDLVTEPQAEWEASSWSAFFVITKMSAAEAVRLIHSSSPFWNKDALRWALESSYNSRSLFYSDSLYNPELSSGSGGISNLTPNETVCGENFSVRSYYSEKSARRNSVGSYYGNMFVVEAYYLNSNNKVNKAIFFPSIDFINVSQSDRRVRDQFKLGKAPNDLTDKQYNELSELSYADVLFHRKNVFSSMEEAITVIPANRAEPSLERQRSICMEIFPTVETIMRLDSSIINYAILAGTPFYKNRVQGDDSQDLLDLEINIDGNMVDLGDRDFVQVPFVTDLNSLLGVRQTLIQHVTSKTFLGGLDGTELMGKGRAEQLTDMRLVRDSRVHKHNVEHFSRGLTDLYRKLFKVILDMKDVPSKLKRNVLVDKQFFSVLFKVLGHPEDIFEYKKEDIVPDTGLPYWFNIEALRQGGSHFGAAELIIYSELKSLVGDGLSQQALQSLNRMLIKAILGTNDALDILGDPKDEFMVDNDQIREAQLENAAILGSVDMGTLSFEPINIRPDKDDHVVHLAQEHNPRAEELIQAIQQVDFTSEALQNASEAELETRANIILKLAAISIHIQQHSEQLDRFGRKRADINQLKEQTNIILQTSEGLFNSLQLLLRSLEAKRQDQELRLKNLSPENEAEKVKQEIQLMQIQAKREESQGKLAIANKIAEHKQRQHIDKQVSKARDRDMKERLADREARIKLLDIQAKREAGERVPVGRPPKERQIR